MADSPFDEATRPRAALGVVLAPAQQRPGQHLRAVHDTFRAALADLEERVAEVRRGEADVAEVRAAVNTFTGQRAEVTLGAFCAQLCEFVTLHHTIEDTAMFPPLARLPRLRPVVERLAAEHVLVHQQIVAVDALCVRLAAAETQATGTPGGAVLVDELEAAVRELARTLRSHFTYEEEELSEPLGLLGLEV